MGRPLKNGPFRRKEIIKRIKAMNESNEKKCNQDMAETIDDFSSDGWTCTIAVHDGRKHVPCIHHRRYGVGHRLGESTQLELTRVTLVTRRNKERRS